MARYVLVVDDDPGGGDIYEGQNYAFYVDGAKASDGSGGDTVAEVILHIEGVEVYRVRFSSPDALPDTTGLTPYRETA